MSQTAKLEKFLQDHTKKHLIFDFDETLFRIHPDRGLYKKKMIETMYEIDPELADSVKKTGKTSARDYVEIFTRKYGSKARDRVLQVTAEIESNFHKPTQQNTELVNFVKNNYTNYTLHIRSSNLTTTFTPILEEHEIVSCFATLVGKDTIELVKGYPDGFYHIHQKYGGEKCDYLMIGNSPKRDGLAAKHAGIDFVHIDPDLVERE